MKEEVEICEIIKERKENILIIIMVICNENNNENERKWK